MRSLVDYLREAARAIRLQRGGADVALPPAALVPAPDTAIVICLACDQVVEVRLPQLLCRHCWAALPFELQERIVDAWLGERFAGGRGQLRAELDHARALIQKRRARALTQHPRT